MRSGVPRQDRVSVVSQAARIPLAKSIHSLSAVHFCAVGASPLPRTLLVAMSASSVPVPTGDLAQLAATESAGGSAFDSTLDEDVELRLQMDRDEHLQGSLPEAVDEVPQGGGNGDDDEYDLYGMNGWSGGPDMTADSAHAEFIRATGHFVSAIGYDVLSPQDPPDAPGASSSGPQ